MSAAEQPMLGRRIKPEHKCEELIRRIQSRDGLRVPREEREVALIELFQSFRYLIRRIAKDTFEEYGKRLGETFQDWEHDTTTTFFELVVDDYVPIEYGGQSAAFAPYIQTKLYFKMKYAGQKMEKQAFRNISTDINEITEFDPDFAGRGARATSLNYEIREALYANLTNAEEEVLRDLEDGEISKLLKQVVAIAKSCLDEREFFVWSHYHFSEDAVREIGPQLNPPISTSRVQQIVQQARKKIFEEIGKQQFALVLKR